MRADNSLKESRIYEFGNFRLNTIERVIERAGRPLSITPKALDVLIVLVENRGRLVEKEDLMRKVWPETFVEDNNLAFNVSVLRKLFGETGASPRYIETVPKRGYRFIGEVVGVPEQLAATEVVRDFAEKLGPLNAESNPPAPLHTTRERCATVDLSKRASKPGSRNRHGIIFTAPRDLRTRTRLFFPISPTGRQIPCLTGRCAKGWRYSSNNRLS